MKNMLIIIGASGHGKVIADISIKMNIWQTISFLDDDNIKNSIGIEVIGRTNDFSKYRVNADFFVAIGNNLVREKVLERLIDEGLSIVSLIHPNATIGQDVEIGIGSVVMAGVVINSSSRIGKGCIINTSSSLDHDNIIEDYVHISPGVSVAGNVCIGKRTWLGIGSVVSNNVSICGDCKIGAGAVVIAKINNPGTYIGVPAKKTNN